MSRTMKAAWGSLAVSVLVLGLKLAAWWVTSSVALYSDALETIINVIAACPPKRRLDRRRRVQLRRHAERLAPWSREAVSQTPAFRVTRQCGER